MVKLTLKLLHLCLFFGVITACSSNKYTSEDGDAVFSQSTTLIEAPNLIGVDIEPPRTDFDACMSTTDFSPENAGIAMNSYQNIDIKDYNKYFKKSGHYDFYIHPIICNSKIYNIDSKSADIAMFELLENGKVKKKWSLSTLNLLEKRNNIISNARLVGNFIYISTSNGWIIKVNIEQQKVIWKKQYQSGFTASPSVANDRLFLISTSDEVYAIDTNDGEMLWKNNNEQNNTTSIQVPPVVIYNDSILVGLSSGKMQLLKQDSGSVSWETKVASAKTSGIIVEIADIDFPPIVYGNVVVAGGIRSSVMGFDIKNGQPLWQIPTGLNSYMLHNDDGFGFFVDSDNNNICFDMRSGGIRWIKKQGGAIKVDKLAGYMNRGKNSYSVQINRFFDSY